jgi:type I restriction-modification system DNA methylase subunit
VDQATHNKKVSFIWGIADDVLRDLFKRGKYPDVILPMCVIRRMDAVLEPTKRAVLDTKKMLDEARITEQRAALCDASGQAFYNTSKFTLRDLKSRGSQQKLLADFEDYLNGFSPNVQDILDNFKFRNQLTTLPNPARGKTLSKAEATLRSFTESSQIICTPRIASPSKFKNLLTAAFAKWYVMYHDKAYDITRPPSSSPH